MTNEKRCWYFASSLIMYSHPEYDRLLEQARNAVQSISPNTENKVIPAKGLYTSGLDWVSRWPNVCQERINGGLLFILDNAGAIGKGVYTEITDVLKKGLPVFLMDRNGRCFSILSLREDFVSYGPDWTQFAYFDVNRLLCLNGQGDTSSSEGERYQEEEWSPF